MQLRAITKHWIVRQWPEHPVTGRIPAGPAIPPWANDRDTGGASRPAACPDMNVDPVLLAFRKWASGDAAG
jgi:hypothetical protein